MSEGLPLWERERSWPLMRPFVYHLVENFVQPDWVSERRVVDFSAGLGDLSRYLIEAGASQVLATVPEPELDPPVTLAGITWRRGVAASRVEAMLEPDSAELFCARMVFQFPRWENDKADVDSMLRQISAVLTPGGRIVIAAHAFFALQRYPSVATEEDADALVTRLRTMATQAPTDVHEILTEEAHTLDGLAEMVQYLGLPPRESSEGTTGFGLRVPLLVDSFVRAGFELELVDDIEPFTYPIGTWKRFATEPETVADLGRQVFTTKRRWLLDDRNRDPYTRPALHRQMLAEVGELVPFVLVPIVRVVARRPG